MAESLTLKDLQKHLIKTIVGSIAGSILLGVISGFTFYYKTTASIDRLNEKQIETSLIIDKHTDQINKATQGMGMSEVQQGAFKERLTAIEESQKQIYNVLLEISAGQKTIIKNNR